MAATFSLQFESTMILHDLEDEISLIFLPPKPAPGAFPLHLYRDPDGEQRGLIRPGARMFVGANDERDVRSIAWRRDGATITFAGGSTLELDLGEASREDVESAMLITELMNFDGRFELSGVDAADDARREVLLDRLDSNSLQIVRRALAEAQESRDLIADALLEQLEELTPAEAEESSLPAVALYLFAVWRDARALPPLVRFLERYGEPAVESLGGVITDDLAAMLRAWDGPEFAVTRAIIESERIERYARMTAMTGLTDAAVLGETDVDAVEQWILDFAGRRLTEVGDETSAVLAEAVAYAAVDLGSSRLVAWVDQAYEHGWVDESMVTRKELRAAVRGGREAAVASGRKRIRNIDDVVKATASWDFFSPTYLERKQREMDDDLDDGVDGELDDDSDATPLLPPVETVRTGPKTGRNDPCPCGSGKKFKKCCGG
ncbi:MAG: DUF1186 domain-containing protein [Thermoanaerobaculia bacterium]